MAKKLGTQELSGKLVDVLEDDPLLPQQTANLILAPQSQIMVGGSPVTTGEQEELCKARYTGFGQVRGELLDGREFSTRWENIQLGKKWRLSKNKANKS